jgi:hypothetical protein
MFTFLPVIHHELAHTLTPPPVVREEPRPVAPPSWPAPARLPDIVHQGKFCVVRVAHGFSEQAFKPAARGGAAQRASVVNAPAVLFDSPPAEWAPPARPAEVVLKLPRRATARAAEPVEAGQISC